MDKIKGKQLKESFTLIEMIVSIAVFSILAVSAGGTFISMSESWNRQKNKVYLIQGVRWAMDSISREVRESAESGLGRLKVSGGGDRLKFGKDRDGDGDFDNSDRPFIYYWIGNGGVWGDSDKLYRGEGNNRPQANANRQEAVNFLVDPNPSGNYIFDLSSGVLTIELTVRPDPDNPPDGGNQDYTLRSKMRPRN